MILRHAKPAFAAIAIALALSACGPSTPKPKSASAGWTGRENVGEAIKLLNGGEPDRARTVLARVLQRQPGDQIAADLLRQIDTPAETLLGTRHFTYVTKAGDTMSNLADRFLNNPTRFYALARYNDITAPEALRPGQTLRIPGVQREEAAKKPRKPAAQAGQSAASAPAPAPAKPAAQARPADPARAARLRSAGLEQLNRGAVGKAVALLQQASQLDPANGLIQRDLERARRINRTIQASGG